MRPDATVRQSPDVVARPLAEGEGGVLLHLASGAYFEVNPVGLLIWELIDGERTIDGLVAALSEQVTGGPSDLRPDVVAFLERASERRLLAVDA